MTARKIGDIEVELVEIGARSPAVVRTMGQIETLHGPVEVAMHINDGAIELRTSTDPVRIFRLNLRQLCERSVATIAAQLSGEAAEQLQEA